MTLSSVCNYLLIHNFDSLLTIWFIQEPSFHLLYCILTKTSSDSYVVFDLLKEKSSVVLALKNDPLVIMAAIYLKVHSHIM